MNDALTQMMELTLSARHYLQTGRVFAIGQTPIHTLRFRFLPQQSLLARGGLPINWRTKVVIANSLEKWLSGLARQEVLDICLAPDQENAHPDRPASGADSFHWSIYGRYAKYSTKWLYQWNFNPKKQRWDVAYAEDPSATYPVVQTENPVDRLREALQSAAAMDQSSDVFSKADAFLSGAAKPTVSYPMLPERNNRLLSALFAIRQSGPTDVWDESASAEWNRTLLAAAQYAVNVW